MQAFTKGTTLNQKQNYTDKGWQKVISGQQPQTHTRVKTEVP